jgi:lipopolysaccharide export system permease protein
MKIIDRYTLKQFLKMLILFLAGVIFIFILVNFFERIDKFVEKRASPISVIKYYLFQVPYLIVLLFPVAHLLATFFSLGEMARKNELLAIKASGINLIRLFKPLILLALLNSFLAFVLSETLSPLGMRIARDVYAVEIRKGTRRFGRTFAKDLSFWGRGNRFFFFESINSTKNMAYGIIMMEFKDGEISKRVDARKGVYAKEGWIFYDVTERIFKGDRDVVNFFKEKKFPEISESPFDFLKGRKELEEMGWKELVRRIEMLKRAGLSYAEDLVEFHTRIAFPFANLVILLFALPLASSLRGRGRAYGFGISVIFSFVYWGIMQFSKALGQVEKLGPLLSAWLPNLIFLGFALLSFRKVKR